MFNYFMETRIGQLPQHAEKSMLILDLIELLSHTIIIFKFCSGYVLPRIHTLFSHSIIDWCIDKHKLAKLWFKIKGNYHGWRWECGAWMGGHAIIWLRGYCHPLLPSKISNLGCIVLVSSYFLGSSLFYKLILLFEQNFP